MELRTFGLLSLLLLATVSGVAMADHGGLHITSTAYEGDAVVHTKSDQVFLWNTEQLNSTVSIETGNTSGTYQVCLLAQPVASPDQNPNELTCQPLRVGPDQTRNVSFGNVSPPANATGEFHLSVVVDDTLRSGDPEATNVTTVTFIGPDDDFDSDGLINREELQAGTELNNSDTDNDTLPDGEERKLGTDPLHPDTDNDGLRDAVEVSLGTDPTRSAVPFYIVGLVLLCGLVYLLYRRLGSALAASVGTATSTVSSTSAVNSEPSDEDDLSSFVTDEDRILQILAENNGRLMQSRLVELTDWSKSKVSRRLSTLEDEGRIRKITLGRENMVALPGHEPDGAQSPFEED